MLQEYPELAKRALEALIPFPTTYLCEAAMSAPVNIKITNRNHLRVATDMRIALSNINLRIDELVSKRREQKSHDYHSCCALPSILRYSTNHLCYAFIKRVF